MSTFFTIALALALPADSSEGNWPAFRGGAAAGVAEDKRLPDTWTTSKNVAWKADVPGRGWSSPIVWGDKVFLTTVTGAGQGGAPKKGLYFGGNQSAPPKDEHQWRVYCLDLQTGKTVWERVVHKGVPLTPLHIKNSYASETPVTDGERVYAYFGMTGLFCYDLDGKLVWKKDLGAFPMQMGWGTGSSPVLEGDRLFIQCDNEEKSFVVALDKKTGDELWRTHRDERIRYSTPFVCKNKPRNEIFADDGR